MNNSQIQSTLDLLNQLVLTAPVLAASPFIQQVIEAIKNGYGTIAGKALPGLVIQILNEVIAFVLSTYYGVYVAHNSWFISVGAGLVLAFATSKYHDNLQVKNALSEATVVTPSIKVDPNQDLTDTAVQ